MQKHSIAMSDKSNQINAATSEVGLPLRNEINENNQSGNMQNYENEINQSENNKNCENEINQNENNKNCETENYSENVKWRELFEIQNKNFTELLKLVQNTKSDNSENTNISLPKFNPESSNADAIAWCSTVDIIMEECSLEGSALIIVLSRSLQGSASQWLSQICFPGIKWLNFKELFMQRYGGVETAAATIAKIFNSRPSDGECLSVYGSRLVSMLMARWTHCSVEEIAVSVALAHVSQFESKLKRLLFTTNIKTRNELQQELKAFAFVNSRNHDADFQCSEPKRIKLSPNLKCHFCGKLGHKIADCRARKLSEKNLVKQNSVGDVSSLNKGRTTLTCYKCGTVGHIASMCSNNNNRMSTNSKKIQPEKRVDTCTVVKPMGNLFQSGESYPFYFDSGAECSIVKESVATTLSGKRYNNVIFLKGIGNATICSSLQILSEVIINNFRLEILFHVVMDDCLRFDTMIGCEILSQGFGVTITFNNIDFFRVKTVYSYFESNESFVLDNVDTDLVGNDKEQLIAILKSFSSSFLEDIPTNRVTTGQLEIRLCDPNKTVQRRPYRLSTDERAIVRDKINQLIKANIVRPSCSPFASPIILVKKKDGSDRLCVDYRELNANTLADKFPLPLISDQIARLAGSKYFSCLDMVSGFHQIPVHPNSIELTAFITPDGQYEYLTMPFGLKNAPSVFQRAIMKALGELAYSYAVVYMDDIMVVASTKEEAFERLQTVLNTLISAGFSFNIRKCSFLKTSVTYLGYEIEDGEIRPNTRKIRALSDLPPPKTVQQLRQFIGLASYFRIFVNKFSQIMKPLYFLTTANTFVWKSEHEKVRKRIISILTSKPVLTIFDPTYPIELHTDASSEGYGAILLHRIGGKPHVVEYFSKKTTEVESRYHSYELETLAVVNAIKHFRHYLQGRKFIVFTDCNSLKASRTKIDLTPRVHRWWAFLQAFDFEITYKEGKHMAHVDFFSRNHIPSNKQQQVRVVEKRILLAEITNDWLLVVQKKDTETCSIVNKLQKNELPEDVAQTYEIRTGILYRKIQRNGKTRCLPVVPRSFRWSIINNVHESIMHLGWEKTLDKVYEYYWFENMSKYVRKFVDNCMTCRLSKPPSGKVPIELHPIPKTSIPWNTLHIDITGKLSGKNDLKEYIIVLIDAFTKFVLLYHTNNIDSSSCVKALHSSISLFGVPNRVIADQGRSFTGKDFREFCSSQKINLHLIATGASRANGQVERVMSTLKSLLTAVETSNRSWQNALGEVQLALNCTVNRVTRATPLEMFIGKEARPLGLIAINTEEQHIDRSSIRKQAAKNIKSSSCYDKLRFDKNKAKIVRFGVGDYVLLKNEERHQTKLDPKFKGPFVVAEVLEGDRYVLKSLKNKRIYKYSHEYLRRFPEEQFPNELNSGDESNESNTENEQDREEGVERDVSEGVERDVSEGVERDVSEGVERDVNEGVERDVNEGVERDVNEGVEKDVNDMGISENAR